MIREATTSRLHQTIFGQSSFTLVKVIISGVECLILLHCVSCRCSNNDGHFMTRPDLLSKLMDIYMRLSFSDKDDANAMLFLVPSCMFCVLNLNQCFIPFIIMCIGCLALCLTIALNSKQ